MNDAEADEVSNVLLVSGSTAEDHDACLELLGTEAPEDVRAIVVDYTRTTEEWQDRWDEHGGTFPEQFAFISVGELSRVESPTSSDLDRRHIEAVEAPEDLTGLGIRLTEYLTEWEGARWDPGPTRTALCFDSLTMMFQYVGFDRGFRFLHELTRKVNETGAVGHYHLTAGAHESEKVARLTELFDRVVEVPAESHEEPV